MNGDLEAARIAAKKREDEYRKKRAEWWRGASSKLSDDVIEFIHTMVAEFDAELMAVKHPDGAVHKVPVELRRPKV